MRDFRERLANELGLGVAENRAEPLVESKETAGEVLMSDADRGVLKRSAEPLFAGAQLQLRPGWRSAISCSNSFGLRMASARGTMGTRAKTVTQETTAVNNLISPATRYAGHQKMTASIRCVVPHARMKATNSQKIVGNGTSFRRKTR